MGQTIALVVGGKPQEIPFTLNPAEMTRADLQAQAEAFAANLDADQLLQHLVAEVIDSAYSQSDDVPRPTEYTDMLQKLSIRRLDFYDDDLVLFLVLDDTPKMTFSCQINYNTPHEIEEIAWDDE